MPPADIDPNPGRHRGIHHSITPAPTVRSANDLGDPLTMRSLPMPRPALVITAVIAGHAATLAAADLFVPSQYPTIQAAIDAAADNDTIRVARGSYNEQLTVDGIDLTIRADDGPDATTLTGAGFSGSILTHGSGALTLDGFTMSNGNAVVGGAIACTTKGTLILSNAQLIGNTAERGGAIAALSGSTIMAQGCVIAANSAGGTGGAIHAELANLTLMGTTFDGNTSSEAGAAIHATQSGVSVQQCAFRNGRAPRGGALDLTTSSLAATACEFTDNVAEEGGGAIAFNSTTGATILRSRLARNFSAGDGGAVLLAQGHLNLRQSILAENASTQSRGGALFVGSAGELLCVNNTIHGNQANEAGGIHSISTFSASVGNCVLWGNTDESGSSPAAQVTGNAAVEYSDIEGGLAGTGNINADPAFNDPDQLDFTFPDTSPIFNAGNIGLLGKLDGLDFNGNPRVTEGNVDMGAIEFRRSTYVVPGDFASISEAIDFVQNGETILVAPGFYNETLDFQGKGINLVAQSQRGEGFMPTIASSGGRVITCVDPAVPAVISGFILSSGDELDGGGALLRGNVTMTDCLIFGCMAQRGGGLTVAGPVTVEGTTFSSNTASADGGAVFIDTNPGGGAPLFRDCTMVTNFAANGAGIACIAPARLVKCNIVDNTATLSGGGILNVNSGNLELLNCRVIDNTASGGGGAIYAGFGAATRVVGCQLTTNSAGNGGALLIQRDTVTRVINCTLSDNDAINDGGGINVIINNTDALVANSIIYNNNSGNEGSEEYFITFDGGGGRGEVNDIIVNHSCVRFGWGGTGMGNISASPMFNDPPNGDYTLALGSPCIDLSDNSAVLRRDSDDLDNDGFLREYYPADVNGVPRFRNGRADLGAMETFTGPSDATWAGAVGAAWGDDSSWFPTTPGPGNNVIFNLADTLARLDLTATHTQLSVDNGSVRLDMQGNELTLTDDLLGPSLGVGVWSDLPVDFAPVDGVINISGSAPMLVGRLGAFTGNALINGSMDVAGQLSPDGDSFSLLEITGSLSLQGTDPFGVTGSGHVFIDIATPRGSAYILDSIDVGDDLHLAGALTLRDDGFTDPPVGTELSIMTCAGTFTGQFDVAFMPGLSAGAFYRVRYDRNPRGIGSRAILVVETLGAGIAFDPSSPFPIGGVATDSAVGDLNGDGLPDLALTIPDGSPLNPGSVVVLINGGNTGNDWNGFTSSVQYTVGRDPIAVDIGELDGAPGLDLAVLNRADDSITVLTNDGSGFLTPGALIPAVIDDGRALIVFDADGDGDQDIAATGLRFGAGRVVIVPNVSARALAFSGPQYFAANDDPGDLDPADFDNDKDPDIVTTNRGGASVSVLRNMGGGGSVNFQKSGDFPVGTHPMASVAEDVDGDGLPDIITGNEGDSVSVVLNRSTGDIAFADTADFTVSGPVRSVVAVDMDGDGFAGQGDADLAVVVVDPQGNGTVRILRNDTTGNQAIFADDGSVEVTGNVLFVEAADVNDDGFNDLVTVNDFTNTRARGLPSERSVRVLLNTRTTCTGDTDGDGMVDMNDLNDLFDFWGTSVTPGTNGDLDYSGFVDFVDLNLLLDEWGATCN
ncbi:MAG: VCBS repeat-containing protein [Phycisphaerales bacterium]|nr:VCBS repeat-containing protein [Phycisphaerales bacterium]